MSALVRHWVRPEIQALAAYKVADAAGLIKLDAMENPYTWPESLQKEWLALLHGVSVNRYPDPHARELSAVLRAAMGVPEGMGLLLGNGSDEIIQIIAMALSGPGRTIVSVEPGFVMYRMIASFCGMRYAGVPLNKDFSLDMPALRQALDEEQPAVVFLAWPNNPTGNLFAEAEVVEIIERAPGLVVVDEAYAPFAQASFISHLGRHDNLVVMRTLSKLGLAGLRLGLLAGPRDWLDEFDKVRLPYNINVLTQLTAKFALQHGAMLEAQTAAIREERESLFQALTSLEGFTPYPSRANFILVRTQAGKADEIFEKLKAGGVLVKKLHGSHPLLHDCLRFTVGRPEETRRLLELLRS